MRKIILFMILVPVFIQAQTSRTAKWGITIFDKDSVLHAGSKTDTTANKGLNDLPLRMEAYLSKFFSRESVSVHGLRYLQWANGGMFNGFANGDLGLSVPLDVSVSNSSWALTGINAGSGKGLYGQSAGVGPGIEGYSATGYGAKGAGVNYGGFFSASSVSGTALIADCAGKWKFYITNTAALFAEDVVPTKTDSVFLGKAGKLWEGIYADSAVFSSLPTGTVRSTNGRLSTSASDSVGSGAALFAKANTSDLRQGAYLSDTTKFPLTSTLRQGAYLSDTTKFVLKSDSTTGVRYVTQKKLNDTAAAIRASITGISSLNGLTAVTQTFAVGTSGSDVGISSVTSTHTFNIPDAGTSARGLVTSGTQSFGGAKTFAARLTASVDAVIPTMYGSTSSGGNTVINSTTNATKGIVQIGQTRGTVFDETTGRMSVGSPTTPLAMMHSSTNSFADKNFYEEVRTSGTSPATYHQLQKMTTGDAVQTTIDSVTLGSNTLTVWQVTVTAGKNSAGSISDAAGFIVAGTFWNNGGTATQVGSTTPIHDGSGVTGWTVAFTVTGAKVRLRVTGASATSITWTTTSTVTIGGNL